MEKQLELLQGVLDIPFIRRIRRNHGLEHATMHLLSQRVPKLRVVGRSDAGGFWIYGPVSTEDVQDCATGALARMRNGEHHLAIHPNCGTNLVTMALLGAGMTFLALIGSERRRFGKLQRLPLVVIGLLMAAVAGQPLGLQLQQHVTTLGDPADLEIVDIRRMNRSGMIMHRIQTRSS